MFNRKAFAFVNRPLTEQGTGFGNMVQMVQDQLTGLTLRLEVTREHKRNRWSFDILFGSGIIRPEFGCRIAG